jgi:cell division protein FtsB
VVAPRARALRAGVLCALVVLCLVSVLAPLSASVRQQSDLAALSAEVESSRTRVEGLRTSVQRWDDPAYVAAQARARLHYVMPGETGYVVLDAPDAAEGASAGAAGATDGAPFAADGAPPVPGAWYAQLWGSVEAAGRS